MGAMSDPPEIDANALARITRRTIDHYDLRADAFWTGTRDHDVDQNRQALLRHIEGQAPLRILDFGCGPGGLDGSIRFCEMAREHTDCEVLHQDMLALDLPASEFDGVFANASLFHVPTQELPRVLRQLRATLRPRGILFASNPRGDNREGWQGERYGAYHDLSRWRALVTTCGFEKLEHYYRPPGKPRSQQPWLATVFRRVEVPLIDREKRSVAGL